MKRHEKRGAIVGGKKNVSISESTNIILFRESVSITVTKPGSYSH